MNIENQTLAEARAIHDWSRQSFHRRAPVSKAHEIALKHQNVEDAIAIHELTLDLKRANFVIAMLIQAGNIPPSMVQEIKAKAMDEVQS